MSDSGSVDEVESLSELVAEELFDFHFTETDEEDIDTTSPPFELFCSYPDNMITPFPGKVAHTTLHQYNTPTVHREPHCLPPENV